MKFIAFTTALLLAVPAMAQPAAPEMVMIPRQTAESVAQWVASPDARTAVQLYAALTACIADNPRDGVVRHMGPDQCTFVTEALAAQAKQLADLTAENAKLKAPVAVPAAEPAQ